MKTAQIRQFAAPDGRPARGLDRGTPSGASRRWTGRTTRRTAWREPGQDGRLAGWRGQAGRLAGRRGGSPDGAAGAHASGSGILCPGRRFAQPVPDLFTGAPRRRRGRGARATAGDTPDPSPKLSPHGEKHPPARPDSRRASPTLPGSRNRRPARWPDSRPVRADWGTRGGNSPRRGPWHGRRGGNSRRKKPERGPSGGNHVRGAGDTAPPAASGLRAEAGRDERRRLGGARGTVGARQNVVGAEAAAVWAGPKQVWATRTRVWATPTTPWTTPTTPWATRPLLFPGPGRPPAAQGHLPARSTCSPTHRNYQRLRFPRARGPAARRALPRPACGARRPRRAGARCSRGRRERASSRRARGGPRGTPPPPCNRARAPC
jgi:hypothetical protein